MKGEKRRLSLSLLAEASVAARSCSLQKRFASCKFCVAALLVVIAAGNGSADKLECAQAELECGSAEWPHPQKLKTGGEDAHFISHRAVGVFDGVGGWVRHGVDPRHYSRYLAHETLAQVLARKSSVSGGIDGIEPLEALDRAARSNPFRGSSTAALAWLQCAAGSSSNEITLHVANIGDGTVVAARNSHVLLQTTPQQHSFNFPFQLGSNSDTRANRDADRLTALLAEGDWILLATDGLLDNVPFADVVDAAARGVAKSLEDRALRLSSCDFLADAAAELARSAQVFGANQSYMSPFAVEARRHGSLWSGFLGGKLDDVTVVLCRIRACDDDSSSHSCSRRAAMN